MPTKIPSLWQVTSSRSWGGRESVPVTLHQAFLDRGIDSRLFCARDSAIAHRFGGQSGVCPLPFAGPLDWSTRRQLIACLHRDPPTVVLCHFSHDLALLRLVLGRTGSPRLFLVKHVGPGRPKTGLLHRWVYRRVDGVLAVSEHIARRCRESYPIDPAQVRVWHPGINVERFRFDPAGRALRRQGLGLADPDVLIGYVARLTPGKGHRELIEAFLSLAKERKNIYLALPGTASSSEMQFAAELRRIAEAAPHGERILWPGFVEDVPSWLWACDIFANPSPAEAFGLNTVEAMAAGRPVLGTTGGGTPDLIADGQNGLLVEPGQTSRMVEVLRRLIEDTGLRNRLGEAGCATVRRRFDMPIVTERLLELVG